MNRTLLRRLRTVEPAEIMDELSNRQHLDPRKPISDVLTGIAAGFGLTLSSVRDAADRMEIDPGRSVGRITRAELEQLSKLIHRTYRHELSAT
jgi:hypothetical protein